MARGRKRNMDAMDEAGEHLNGGEERRPALNSAARAVIIREACETIGELERQVDAIKSEIKMVKETRIKGDLGMKLKSFNLAYKLHQAGRDERDDLADVCRELFSALGTGESVDWVRAAEGVGAEV
jgi:hypothetical protein